VGKESKEPNREVRTPTAEVLHAEELAFLQSLDAATEAPKPPGWQLSPRTAVTFVMGSAGEPLKLPKGSKTRARGRWSSPKSSSAIVPSSSDRSSRSQASVGCSW